jgi:hypothetical protein
MVNVPKGAASLLSAFAGLLGSTLNANPALSFPFSTFN